MKVVLNNITKSYRSGDGTSLNILEQVSTELPSGCTVSIRGPSGVGKSTLLYVIAGLEGIDSGSLLIGDTVISEFDTDQMAAFRRKNIGLVFQFHHLLPEFTAIENIAMPLLVAGVGDDESISRAEVMLDKVGLKNRGGHRPTTLSGGEQQRVAVARALIANPGLVLADEPTGNLDPKTGQEIGTLLKDLQAEQGNTLIVVTHSVELGDSLDAHFTMLPGGSLVYG